MNGGARVRSLLLLAALPFVAAGVRTSEAAPAAEAPAAVRAHARCMRAMAEATCVAAPAGGAPAADSSAPRAAAVFVAGVGPVPGDVYRQLVRADAGMCDLVRAACARDPLGSVCSTASRLW